MKTFELYRSRHREKEKIAEYPHREQVSCLKELEQVCQYDHISACCNENHRASEYFESCNVIHMDVDNTHSDDPESWVTPDDIAEAFPGVEFYYIYSRNHMKPKVKDGRAQEPRGKYHVYLPTSHRITGYETAKNMRNFICCMFPYFDKECIDPVHLFYGVENASGGEYDGTLCIDEYLQSLGSKLPEQARKRVEEYDKLGYSPIDELKKFLGIKSDKKKGNTFTAPEVIAEGQRNGTLYKLACSLQSKGLSDEAILSAVMTENEQKCSPPLKVDEVEAVVNSALKYEKGNAELKRIEQGFQHLKEYKEQQEQAPKKAVKKLKTISAKELQEKNLPPIRYIVKDLIPQGETVIAAPPKSGKSWLMLQLCLSVARGEPFLGLETEKCSTLYLALEDGDKFEQDRLNKQCPEDAPDNFHYVFEDVEKMESGLLEQLSEFVEEVPEIGLIVIDTLAYVKNSQKRQETAYECDYRTGKELKAFADAHNLAIVVITHTTKITHPEDPFSNITGTMGVSGAADAMAVLVREKRFDSECNLAVTGRRVPMNEYKVKWDKESCKWSMIGIVEAGEDTEARREHNEYMKSSIRAAILKIAQTEGKWKGSACRIKEKAAELDIFITESNKEVGGFMHNKVGFFGKIDGIKVSTISNGNASKLYSIDYIATGTQTKL